jgi:exosortase family protein XrtF
LKQYFIQYKPFLVFLAKFFITYLVIAGLYSWYLDYYHQQNLIDGFTLLVANQAASVLRFLDFEFVIELRNLDFSVMYIIDNKLFVRIIEGCNVMSVIILFVAFVVAFSGKPFKTLAFIVLGSLVIHFLNILRIGLLTIGIYKFPEYKTVLHDLVFPLFIYGVVFGLWVLWVNKFSDYDKKVTS